MQQHAHILQFNFAIVQVYNSWNEPDYFKLRRMVKIVDIILRVDFTEKWAMFSYAVSICT